MTFDNSEKVTFLNAFDILSIPKPLEQMTYDEFRDTVVIIVKRRLKKYDWFRGVCLDEIKYHNGAIISTLDIACEQAFINSIYYDAPNSGMDL